MFISYKKIMKKYIIVSLLVFGIFIPSVSSAQVGTEIQSIPKCITLTNTLRYGSRDTSINGQVAILQTFLRSKNYLNSNVDGKFGPLTRAGVKSWQASAGLSFDGIVGPLSRAKINALICASPVAEGYMYITPTNAEIVMGNNVTFQAMYQAPMPPCLTGFACVQMMPEAYVVQATWTSSDTKIATTAYKDNCPAGAQCLVYQPDYLTALVTGVSKGSATITATYKDSLGKTFSASSNVTVK